MLLGLAAATLDPAPQDQQSGELVGRERKGLAHGGFTTKAVGLVVISGTAAVERAVDGRGPRLGLLFGDHLGTPAA